MRTRTVTPPATDDRPVLTVDLGALRRNMRALRALRPSVPLMPVVKADAYGLGAKEVVPVLSHEGAAGFFTSYREEAEEIGLAAGGLPIYVLNARPGTGGYTEQVRPVHYTAAGVGGYGGPCGVQVEGGMHRMGEQLGALLALPPQPQVALVIMHMSHAGEPAAPANDAQRRTFAEAMRELKQVFPNAAFGHSASGGVLQGGHPEEGFVRPGICLYGAKAGMLGPLETVAKLEALVLSVFGVEAGGGVGYGHRFTAGEPMQLATLAIGYADGPPRALANKGEVVIRGVRCPYVGAVSMDLLTVDAGAAGGVRPGERAEIFGPNLPVDELAAKAGTIGYELLTSVGQRVRRQYVD